MASMSDGTHEHPYSYRSTVDQVDAIRLETQELTPGMQQGYQEVERFVGDVFIREYGDALLLRNSQRQYLLDPHCQIIADERLVNFTEIWQSPNIQDRNMADLNGVLYTGYSIAPKYVDGEVEKGQQGGAVAGTLIWSGRVPVFVTSSSMMDVEVGAKYLDRDFKAKQPKVDFKSKIDYATQLTNRINGGRSMGASNHFASKAVHEKVHGIQNLDLPLPILEASAYFFERTVMKRMNPVGTSMPGFEEGASFYGELASKYGDDLHRLVFGTLRNQPYANKLLDRVKGEFSPQKMKEVFPDVIWRTEPGKVVVQRR